MTRTLVAVIQTPWDCRHGQPGHRVTGVSEGQQPEGLWVCTRQTEAGIRRTVTDEECATCAYWTAEDAPTASALAAPDFAFPDVSARATRRRLRRTLLGGAGLALIGLGAGLGLTIVMAPVGVAFIVFGVGVFAAGIRDETEQLA